MCLKACRRLPLNAPCVSLRLTTNPPPLVVEEAAKALLSGGAHPILYNDDKMVEGLSIAFLTRTIPLSVLYMLKLCIWLSHTHFVGLHEVLCSSYDKLNLPRPPNLLEDARSYSCDGCYEPMFTGASEFKFAYVNLLKVCNSLYVWKLWMFQIRYHIIDVLHCMNRLWCLHWILVEITRQPVHFIWQEMLAHGGPHWPRTSQHLISSRSIARMHIHSLCCLANAQLSHCWIIISCVYVYAYSVYMHRTSVFTVFNTI